MNIIKDNDMLLSYIPNVVSAVEGESDLYTKLLPHLALAESWFYRKVCKQIALQSSEDAMSLARTIVATEVFRAAIPSLNVILTANGFGIVSNQTTAPASKERTESLIEALVEQRDNAIEQLAFCLSGKHLQFANTIFQGFEAQRMQGFTSHLFDHLIEQRSAVVRSQTTLAEDVLSEEVLKDMVAATYADETSRSAGVAFLFAYVPGIIIKQLKGEDCKNDICRVVEYLRTHPEFFPQWEQSHAAKHWQDYTYKNDKKSGGFWLW